MNKHIESQSLVGFIEGKKGKQDTLEECVCVQCTCYWKATCQKGDGQYV